MPSLTDNYGVDPLALNFSEAPLILGGADNPVPCFESIKNVTESISINDGPGLQRSYYCPGPQRLYLAQWMTGFATAAGGRNGTITRQPPYRHPEASGCYATGITIENIGQPYRIPTIGVAYPVARLNVQFGTLPYQPFPDLNQNGTIDDSSGSWVYCEQTIEMGEESIEIPASAWQYDATNSSGGSGLQNIPAIRSKVIGLPILNVRADFFALATYPDQIWNFYGYTNQDVFLGFTQGKVKYMGAAIKNRFQSNGTTVTQMTNTYSIRPMKDWNYEINPQPSAGASIWVRSSYKAGDTLFFPYGDLTQTVPNPNYTGGTAGGPPSGGGS